MSDGLHPRLGEGGGARADAGRIGQVDVAAHLPLHALPRAHHLHQRPLQAAGDLRRDDDQRAAAVRDHAAVQPVQRRGDQRRSHHLLHRHHVPQHGVLVVLGVVGGGDLHPGELLGGRAELVHVPRRDHRIGIHRGDAEREFPLRVRRIGAADARRGARMPLRARPPRQGDQRDRALAGGDRFGRMRHMGDVGTAADIGAVVVAQREIHVVGHGQRAEAGRVAGAEVAVDVLLGQPGVAQGAERRFRVQLGDGLVLGQPRRVLIGTGDIGLPLDRHALGRSPSLPGHWWPGGHSLAPEQPGGKARPGRPAGRDDAGGGTGKTASGPKPPFGV